jgi:TldD protein
LRAWTAPAADVRPLVRLSVTVIAEQDGRREVGSLAAAAAGLATSTTPSCATTSTRPSRALTNLQSARRRPAR